MKNQSSVGMVSALAGVILLAVAITVGGAILTPAPTPTAAARADALRELIVAERLDGEATELLAYYYSERSSDRNQLELVEITAKEAAARVAAAKARVAQTQR